MDHPIGAVIGMAASAWASFMFLRGAITGASPLYSKGRRQRSLHFAAGIIFGLLTIGLSVLLARK